MPQITLAVKKVTEMTAAALAVKFRLWTAIPRRDVPLGVRTVQCGQNTDFFSFG